MITIERLRAPMLHVLLKAPMPQEADIACFSIKALLIEACGRARAVALQVNPGNNQKLKGHSKNGENNRTSEKDFSTAQRRKEGRANETSASERQAHQQLSEMRRPRRRRDRRRRHHGSAKQRATVFFFGNQLIIRDHRQWDEEEWKVNRETATP